VLFYEVELIPFYLLIAIWVEHPAWLRSHEVSHLYSCFWDFDSGSILGLNLAQWFLYL